MTKPHGKIQVQRTRAPVREEVVCVRLDTELRTDVERAAKKSGVSTSVWLRAVAKDAIDREVVIEVV